MKKIFTVIICLLLINIAVKVQGDSKTSRAKLLMSLIEKEYYVKQIGTNYVLNGDVIVGFTLQRLAIYQGSNTGVAYI